jgi:hypothetical protein
MPLCRRHMGRRLRTEQALQRVVAEERGERLPTGGSEATEWACAAPTPFANRPPDIDPGRLFARPMTINEKKIPMDNTMPEFMNVAWIPAAPPR